MLIGSIDLILFDKLFVWIVPIVVRLERGLRLNAKEYWYFIRLPFMNKVYDIEWENQTKNTLVEGRCSPTSFPGSLFSASFVLNDKGGREERPWDQGWMFTLFANSASQKCYSIPM